MATMVQLMMTVLTSTGMLAAKMVNRRGIQMNGTSVPSKPSSKTVSMHTCTSQNTKASEELCATIRSHMMRIEHLLKLKQRADNMTASRMSRITGITKVSLIRLCSQLTLASRMIYLLLSSPLMAMEKISKSLQRKPISFGKLLRLISPIIIRVDRREPLSSSLAGHMMMLSKNAPSLPKLATWVLRFSLHKSPFSPMSGLKMVSLIHGI